ncbi:ISAs1 family transposase [Chitinophagaceae bacterium LY-5]|uniref:ISAs1 family transposase n=1 Tax=Polluticaenibacter yanchengensis TaxID=3014562 RepID=A0ABT4UPW7_9BACT|nr:ISAs1 family transposase [Chitinophagaceae bacterium LY-5]
MPKKTTEVIVTSKNNYVIGVKGNQRKLFNEIKTIFSANKMSSKYITLDKNKGRSELRLIRVSDSIDGISKEWIGLAQIIEIHRIVKDKRLKNGQSEEVRYYISSLKGNAMLYSKQIREHWRIENSLHWVKDVTFKEDSSKIRVGNAPENLSTMRNAAINIFRLNKYSNLAQAIRLGSNDIQTICKLIS